MSKNNESTPNYLLRRTAVGGLAALALAGAAEGGKALHDRMVREHTTVPVPAAGSEYKTFHLNEKFKVGDEEVTINSLSTASVLAELPGVDSRATLEMLQEQLPKGMSVSEVPAGMTFKLPANSQIGDLHTGE